MSTLVTQLYLLEKYGPRLTTEQLAEVLTSDAGTILNQVSAGTFGVPTYVDGRRRFADVSDVAAYLAAKRASAAPRASLLAAGSCSDAASPTVHPRVRGEQALNHSPTGSVIGSSPRARGTAR